MRRYIASFPLLSCCWLFQYGGAREIPGGYDHVVNMQIQSDASLLLEEEETTFDTKSCARALQDLSIRPHEQDKSVFSQVSFTVHRNGEPDACGVVGPSVTAMQEALASMQTYDEALTKYQVESFLTRFLANRLGSSTCSPTDDEERTSLLGYCDMGPERTVIQKDYNDLVRIPSADGATASLPCRMFTREGLRITSLEQLKDLALGAKRKATEECSDPADAQTCPVPTLHLYAVPAGRMFMFGPSYVGEVFEISHVQDSNGNNVVLKTIALEPRVFDIFNFFTAEESEKLVQKALGETSETHKFHRSTTGTTGASIFSKRTSENAWDTHGTTALVIKKRCFTLLGIDEYQEELSDGLQILRYNLTTAYTSHFDYLEDNTGKEIYDYDSSGKGGNRFATILLYFTDLPEGGGGETVFSDSWPPGLPEEERVELPDAIKQLRESGDAAILKRGSWEEEMVAKCRTRLAVKPSALRSVLFYSQFPNGTLDPASNHGGCPVLKGTKIAANLWTWSGIRPEFAGAPRKRELTEEEIDAMTPKTISAVFKNSGKDKRFDSTTKVYYDEDGFFGNLGPNDPPVWVNTYKTHVWNIKVNGKTLKSWTITSDESYQEFVV